MAYDQQLNVPKESLVLYFYWIEINNAQSTSKQVSIADLIVLAGVTAIEEAAEAAGQSVQIPFTPGRTDATEAQTDLESYGLLEPRADGFRNYLSEGLIRSSEEMLKGLLAHQETLRKDFADALETDPKTIQTALDVARATIETLKGNPAGFLTAALQLIVSIDSIADLWNKDESEFRYSLPETEKHKAEIQAQNEKMGPAETWVTCVPSRPSVRALDHIVRASPQSPNQGRGCHSSPAPTSAANVNRGAAARA